MSRLKKIEHLAELEDALRDDADMMRARSGSTVRLNLDDAADVVKEVRELVEKFPLLVRSALLDHRRHDHQQNVWLPQVRCECGEVMMSNRFRGHIADEIVKAVLGETL